MSIDEKLDRIIELLEKLANRGAFGPSRLLGSPPRKECKCRKGIMRVGNFHDYGCPLHERPTLRG